LQPASDCGSIEPDARRYLIGRPDDPASHSAPPPRTREGNAVGKYHPLQREQSDFYVEVAPDLRWPWRLSYQPPGARTARVAVATSHASRQAIRRELDGATRNPSDCESEVGGDSRSPQSRVGTGEPLCCPTVEVNGLVRAGPHIGKMRGATHDQSQRESAANSNDELADRRGAARSNSGAQEPIKGVRSLLLHRWRGMRIGIEGDGGL
jgi:hypothetical protein